jgi:hypothetical protein
VQVAGQLIDPSLELTAPLPVALTLSSDALVHTTNAWASRLSAVSIGRGLNTMTLQP